MTIKIRISNEDSRENAVINVQVVENYDISENVKNIELSGGENTEEWIHSNRHIIIKEIRNG